MGPFKSSLQTPAVKEGQSFGNRPWHRNQQKTLYSQRETKSWYLLTNVSTSPAKHSSFGHLEIFFLLKAGGGIALGVIAAWITSHLMHLVDAYQVEILLTLALALGGYALADIWHLSAPSKPSPQPSLYAASTQNHPPA